MHLPAAHRGHRPSLPGCTPYKRTLGLFSLYGVEVQPYLQVFGGNEAEKGIAGLEAPERRCHTAAGTPALTRSIRGPAPQA